MRDGRIYFNFHMPYEGGEVSIEGYITKFIPARTNCSNEDACPAEGGEIEDFKAFLGEVEIEGPELTGILEMFQDEIYAKVDEDYDREMNGD